MNAQPLVPATSDATDLKALTSNHFLLGTAGSVLPSHQRAKVDPCKRYVSAKAYFDAIWNRWLKDYLPSFNKRSKWPSQPEKQLKTGDLVWIIEPSSPRGLYPLARVTKLNFGSDSIARSAELKTNTGRLVRLVVKPSIVLPFPDAEPFHLYHRTLDSENMKQDDSQY